jgi:dihydrofolate reductase
MNLISLAAIDENRVIADSEEGIPWNIEEDKRHYVDTIAGQVVISGRKTAIAATRGPGISRITDNTNIILTKQDIDVDKENIKISNSIGDALAKAELTTSEDVYVIGGGEIYEQLLPLCDKMVISHIPIDSGGDIKYPEWDEQAWEVTSSKKFDEFEVKEYARLKSEN